MSRGGLSFRPLTSARWKDFERLFGPNGACGGCWCMWWRQTRREFDENHGEGNRAAMKRIVDSGEVPGIIAYEDGAPVGWCSVAPRERFPSLDRSRVLKRIDEEPVWSVVCFYVAAEHRGQHMADALVKAAVEHVRANGGSILEAYPVRPRGKRLQSASSFMGVPSWFERAGFVECARPSDARVIMRRRVRQGTVGADGRGPTRTGTRASRVPGRRR
ncbi:MAG: GNAT family N-acetyltransferase [Candidatus Eisenbacteria bacterium]|nr:GNAT family N-acetyltransferase [Candidatus Eisenbacteria bacterium]